MISWEINPTVLLALVVQAVFVIVFLVRTKAQAEDASHQADAAKRRADLAHERIGIMAEAHALFREQVAKEYVSRAVLGEMEERVTRAIDRLTDKVDEAILTRKMT